MLKLFKYFLLVPFFVPSARAELLFDPLTFLNDSSSGNIVLVGGTTLTSSTDYDLKDVFSVSGSAERGTLDFGALYSLKPEIGLYGSLLYNLSSDLEVLGDKASLDGFQLAVGGFSRIGDISSFPTVVWAELNIVRESLEESEVNEFDGSVETVSADLSGTELTGGILFRVLENNALTVSAGAELILMSNGDYKEDGESVDAERSDMLGLKAIGQYKLNSSTYITGYLNFVNETKLGVTASFSL